MQFRVNLLILLVLLLLFPGAVSAQAQPFKPEVRVTPEGAAGLQPRTRPKLIYVADFRMNNQAIHRDEGPLGAGLLRRAPVGRQRNPELTPGEVSALLADSLTRNLNAASLPAQRLSSAQWQPRQGWLIQGQIVEVDEGNRVRRSVAGFGAGATHLEVQVQVANLASSAGTPFLLFGTSTGSGNKPGGVVTMNPYVAAAKFVMERNASRKDINRTAAEITTEIVKYMRKIGLY
jgi:Domain of unknown function (DUF4410)